jgi:hypothetical protein
MVKVGLRERDLARSFDLHRQLDFCHLPEPALFTTPPARQQP